MDDSNDRQGNEILREYKFLFASLWTAQLSLGTTIALSGQTLLYIGLYIGERLPFVSILYTARSIGSILGSIGTGFIFRRLSDGWKKMLWISSGLIGMAISIIALPFIGDAQELYGILFLFGISSSMVETADNSLVIYLLGQIESRPIVQSLHFMVALGEFSVPFITMPFFSHIDQSIVIDIVCHFTVRNRNYTNSTVPDLPHSMQRLVSSPLHKSYAIIGSLCAIASIMFITLAFRRPTISQYGQLEEEEDDSDSLSNTGKRFNIFICNYDGNDNKTKIALILLFILFYFFHCGTEYVFWGHLEAFGLCSALKLSSKDASMLYKVFSGGFLAGRCCGIFLSRRVRPGRIIFASSTGCIIASTILAIWGEMDIKVPTISSTMYGFSVAMMFAAGISWLAQYIDVTGAVSSIWFIGAFLGISILPPVTGMLFIANVGAIGVMYTIWGASIATLLIFIGMRKLLQSLEETECARQIKSIYMN